jgi:hypothetical protein
MSFWHFSAGNAASPRQDIRFEVGVRSECLSDVSQMLTAVLTCSVQRRSTSISL